MKKLILAISLAVICTSTSVGQSQTNGNASASNDTSASKQGKQGEIQSGTEVAARLENSLDVRHAKPGDRVVMKTLQPIKQNGQTVVPKGSRLVGHVTDVTQRSKSNDGSSMGIALDSLQRGSMNIPITGSIMSITQRQAGPALRTMIWLDPTRCYRRLRAQARVAAPPGDNVAAVVCWVVGVTQLAAS